MIEPVNCASQAGGAASCWLSGHDCLPVICVTASDVPNPDFAWQETPAHSCRQTRGCQGGECRDNGSTVGFEPLPLGTSALLMTTALAFESLLIFIGGEGGMNNKNG
jgi:hypothetical protein